ncbi:hypothetical protein YDYSG_56920 [Paenibacillus tyrfis]|uniref:hypothetical protein n=1 Tax=Paenibacillus tyrfis TaxID=1501230 RepID=UPI002491A9F6|nr:hypothetical protein [Paenibacillus tyrfis]GLI09660.1 hypothetical protein YDYSG_56920 [Paenibacillus tyrfis]
MNPFDGVELGISARPLFLLFGFAFGAGIIGWLLSAVIPRSVAKYISIGLFLVSFYSWIKFI